MSPSEAEPDGGARPDILDYTNHRQFLSDFYAFRKSADPKFSLRSFAELARFSGHGRQPEPVQEDLAQAREGP